MENSIFRDNVPVISNREIVLAFHKKILRDRRASLDDILEMKNAGSREVVEGDVNAAHDLALILSELIQNRHEVRLDNLVDLEKIANRMKS